MTDFGYTMMTEQGHAGILSGNPFRLGLGSGENLNEHVSL
jgi:hypothetical protein